MTEILYLLIPNLVLWLYVWIVPPIVIRVEKLRYFGVDAFGMNILNFIILTEKGDTESVFRHEYEHLRQQQIFSPMGLALVILFHYGYLYIRYRSFAEVYRRSFIEKWANDKMYDSGPLPKKIIRFTLK